MAKDDSILTEYDPETGEYEPVGSGISREDIARVLGSPTKNEAALDPDDPRLAETNGGEDEEWEEIEVVDDDEDLDDDDEDDWDEYEEDDWDDDDYEVDDVHLPTPSVNQAPAINLTVPKGAIQVTVNVPEQKAPIVTVQPARVQVEPRIEVKPPNVTVRPQVDIKMPEAKQLPPTSKPTRAKIQHSDGTTSSVELE